MKDEKVGKPTEGPYRAAFKKAGEVAVAFVILAPTRQPIAHMGPLGGVEMVTDAHASEGDLRANAHLLAAAWDMREALVAWVEMADAAIEQYGVSPSRRELTILDQAKAALAKSRGEA